MPSKLRKALGAVKDQTSISLAKVTHAANLEVTILKATTHDKNPIEERYINEIVSVVSSSKIYASVCAQCIAKRIGKTRNWVVALKCLMIILRIFQDGDPYFPREVFHAMKRGAKILNLSSFKDDSSSSPWEYNIFVRAFALYLDERLDCFLTGKLQRRFTPHNRFHQMNQKNKFSTEPGIKDMKPMMVLDRISHWQRLLDRAIGTRPTGSAKTNRLVQVSLYAIVQESFDLYRDISDGLAVVLDNFFNMPFLACVAAFNACVKSYKQFDELSNFYSFCASVGVGRSYEYPRVQKVSEELMETLQDFLKDQAYSFPEEHFSTPNCQATSSSSLDDSRFFETASEYGSQCTSLEDLMSATDTTLSPRRSFGQDTNSSSDESDQDEKESQDDDDDDEDEDDDYVLGYGFTNVDQTSRSSFYEFHQEVQPNQTIEWQYQNTTKHDSNNNNNTKDCWELVLANTVTTTPVEVKPKLANELDPFTTLFDQVPVSQHKYNPFLDDTDQTINAPSTSTVNVFDMFDMEPTFKATPPIFYTQDCNASTFSTQNPCSIDDLDLIFGDLNPNYERTVEPTFKAQVSSTETIMKMPQSFDDIIVEPSFQTQYSFKNDSSPPTFAVHNNINFIDTMEAPTNIAPQETNLSTVPLYSQAQSFQEAIVPPTFSAKDSNGTMLGATIEDDLFGPWPSAKNDEYILNVSMQEENLLRQRQLWLEQQNKIIAKYLT